ncbi:MULTISPECIES: Lon protease family protein [Thalassolituus]|jgi:predicted ATP-dependent protease|uniref:Lon protease family protein n=1 Tax=Thalassolituus TaxID=187492 RepID=UPI001CE34908|nr:MULTISPECIES: ATP-binding protein [Thalassolituus]MCA6061136.1 AAA family ATPase [Thalassolituus sp. ST750PaO-4]MCB2387540.1 AAA family ATPase [Thalassolituus alkanivorans]MCB2425221.1 AAA family ATPase [Thalassolituus alkanivorans]
MAKSQTAVNASALTQSINPSALTFADTRELETFQGVLGQDRAVNAIQFGVAMQRPGYNIFVMGETGTGRSSYVRDYLKSEAKRQATPSVWCYVNNFRNPREPQAVEMLPQEAGIFRQQISELIDQLLATFPAALEHPTYQQKKSAIDYVFNRRYDKAIEHVEREAHKRGVAVYRDSSAISFTPMREGKALDETEFAQLSEEEREGFHNNIAELEQMLSDQLAELPQWKRESSNDLRQLNQETIKNAITPLIEPIRNRFEGHEKLLAYLQDMEEHLPRLVLEELVEERLLELREEYVKRSSLEESLMPNIATHHVENSGAPVIYEPHPSYANLFGRIEYANEQGALVTNYQRICPGALHKANGGYLILDAEKVLSEPLVWDALKRALQSRQLKMESPYSEMGLINTTTLLPAVIPLDFKLVLIGSRQVYYLLQEYDEDFKRLFRAVVDFDSDLPLNDDHLLAYARLLKSRIEEQGYADLDQSAVVRMVRYSARLAEQQDVLSARIGEQFDLLAEADFIRQLAQDELICADHIDRALAAKFERTGRVYDKLFEQMLDGTVLLETSGKAIGKINGLTVMSLGDTSFGSPARITATVYPGSKGVVDIEREVSLGQAIHSKGVMILSGFLGNRYAQRFPLAISAHIAMEQSYGYIDGDSASLGELCCLISALIHSPIEQSYAITGSVNQYGEVQAIGGVNEKIEGFFRLCAARGLNGDQGVIIPASNRLNLILNDDVVRAVAAGNFHIHCVTHVDQAIEILMKRKAGKMNSKGEFPAGSVNGDIIARLEAIARMGEKRQSD